MRLPDNEFLAGFEKASIPEAEWHHREHLRAVYLYITKYGLDEAVDRMRAGIKKLNAAHGLVETPTRGYHETATQMWARIVAMTIEEYGEAASSDEFIDSQPQLLTPKLNRLYYSKELFMSAEARRGWVEPDLAPLPLKTR